MSKKETKERLSIKERLSGDGPLVLEHLYEMVFKDVGWESRGGKSKPEFVKWVLMPIVMQWMGYAPKSTEPTNAKLTSALKQTTNEESGANNGLTEVFYTTFHDNVCVDTKTREGVHRFHYLNQQYMHLQNKFNNDEKRANVLNELQIKKLIEMTYLELMHKKAPWLASSGVNRLTSVAVEDVCRLLTVAVIISLNRKSSTGDKVSKEPLDELCLEFLYYKPETLPDFTLKEILDTLLKGRDKGAVPTPDPEKFILKDMAQVSELDCLCILLSGIPDCYTIIPQGGAPEGTDEPYANAKQILENSAIQHKIKNLKGFYARYANKQHLDNLWKDISGSLKNNLCAFEQMYRSVDNGTNNAEALEQIRRGEFRSFGEMKDRFVNMLLQCSWVEPICSTFWSGHDVKEAINQADVFDCITAFVLIAIYCLKTKLCGSDDAIPENRENFKKALIQKIKEVFFPDNQTLIQQTNNDLQQLITGLENGVIVDIPPEDLLPLLGNMKCVLDLLRGMWLKNRKIPAEYENLLINYLMSKIDPNTRDEEYDRDKAMLKLLELGSNSPKGGK